MREKPIDTSVALRKEFGISLTQCKSIIVNHPNKRSEELIRRTRLGLIEITTAEEARAELKSRRKTIANERRRTTIAYKKELAEKVVKGPWGPR